MGMPRKGAKRLIHKDHYYLWTMRNLKGVNELMVELAAAVEGQTLVVTLPKVVDNAMVPLAIDFGRANGWKPEEEGAPFRCRYTMRKAFVFDA